MAKKTTKAQKAEKTASKAPAAEENKKPKPAAKDAKPIQAEGTDTDPALETKAKEPASKPPAAEKREPAKPDVKATKAKPPEDEPKARPSSADTARKIQAWNNQQAPPVGVIVKGEGGEKFETTTRSQAFERQGAAFVFVEGLPQPIALANLTRTK